MPQEPGAQSGEGEAVNSAECMHAFAECIRAQARGNRRAFDENADIVRRAAAVENANQMTEGTPADGQPGVKNLLDILISIKGYTKDELVYLYKDKGYADLKKDVADAIIDELAPIQEKVNILLKDKKALEEIYKLGAEKANYVAIKNLRKMQKKIGLIPRS